jgi:hypothetical protein
VGKQSFYPVGEDSVVDEQKYREIEEWGEGGTRNGPQKTTTIPRVSCPGRTREIMASSSCFFRPEESYSFVNSEDVAKTATAVIPVHA